jgi:hypothetical protein
MVINPLDELPVFIDSGKNVLSNTQRPVNGQTDSILVGIPEVPPSNGISGGIIASTLPFVFEVDSVVWQEQNSGLFTVEIPASLHKKGRNPSVMVYKKKDQNFMKILPDEIILSYVGDITVQISDPIIGKIVVYN